MDAREAQPGRRAGRRAGRRPADRNHRVRRNARRCRLLGRRATRLAAAPCCALGIRRAAARRRARGRRTPCDGRRAVATRLRDRGHGWLHRRCAPAMALHGKYLDTAISRTAVGIDLALPDRFLYGFSQLGFWGTVGAVLHAADQRRRRSTGSAARRANRTAARRNSARRRAPRGAARTSRAAVSARDAWAGRAAVRIGSSGGRPGPRCADPLPARGDSGTAPPALDARRGVPVTDGVPRCHRHRRPAGRRPRRRDRNRVDAARATGVAGAEDAGTRAEQRPPLRTGGCTNRRDCHRGPVGVSRACGRRCCAAGGSRPGEPSPGGDARLRRLDHAPARPAGPEYTSDHAGRSRGD